MKEDKAAESYLVRLMKHIIKWFVQPEKRSSSWLRSIEDSRTKLKKIKKDKPSINKSFLLKRWDQLFKTAKKDAEKDMGKAAEIENLTEKQVFDDEYKLEGDENPQSQDPKKAKKKRRRNK